VIGKLWLLVLYPAPGEIVHSKGTMGGREADIGVRILTLLPERD
jgi:hypothetical protein